MFPPSQAQDVNQALEDAWMLRGRLRAQWDLPAALRRYEFYERYGYGAFPDWPPARSRTGRHTRSPASPRA
jgi:hypothetical protein